MDFFKAQRDAHRSTKTLIFLFACAVVCLIFGLYLIISFMVDVTNAHAEWSRGKILLVSTIGTLVTVGSGTIYKVRQLCGGGPAVCAMMGARPVPLTAPDFQTRQLRNVVEEMALAAGVPVPHLFVLEREVGLNAFAAGFTPRDAAICVTRGCIEEFTRDELQGVIAHEFSHILNGDMRLNIRLMGVLHGIICISLAGSTLIRHSQLSGARRGQSLFPMIMLGMSLIVLGSIGAFFGRLIKAAVSRRREFLADASAVQFTRNPAGIRNALAKIGGFVHAGHVDSVRARSASHMFFAQALFGSGANWFATHPPIEERLRAIEPAFRQQRAAIAATQAASAVAAASGLAGGAAMGFAPRASVAGATATDKSVSPAQALASVGNVSPESVAYGRHILNELPLDITVALHDPFSARALVYCLVLDPDAGTRRRQFQRLQAAADPATADPATADSATADPATAREALALSSSVQTLSPHLRLPLIDLAMPALRTMSEQQTQAFRTIVHDLIEAVPGFSPFEFALEKILSRQLDDVRFGAAPRAIRFRLLGEVLDDCRGILSVLAHFGHDHDAEAAAAFAAGAAVLDFGELQPVPIEECTRDRLDRAVDRLLLASAEVKKVALTAFAHAAASDGKLQASETELLRAIAETIDCPMPPIPLIDAAQPMLQTASHRN